MWPHFDVFIALKYLIFISLMIYCAINKKDEINLIFILVFVVLLLLSPRSTQDFHVTVDLFTRVNKPPDSFLVQPGEGVFL